MRRLPRLGQARGAALDDAELLRVRIALSGVGRLSGRFGVERIAQVLTGSQEREILDRGLDRVPTYGKLAGIPIGQVKDLLNVLADAGLIERQGIEGGRPGAFVLALTAEGRRVAMGEVRPELALPSEPAADLEAAALARGPAAGSGGRGRLAPRRQARPGGPGSRSGTARPAQGLAHRRGPTKVDATLRHLPRPDAGRARRRAARDLQGLRQVPGIGPAKLEAYGAALLALLGEG